MSVWSGGETEVPRLNCRHRLVQCALSGTSPEPRAVGQGTANGLMGSALRLSIHSNNTSMMAAVVLTRVLVGKTTPFVEAFFAAESMLVLNSLFLNRMPLKGPPTLHPNAMRALYPITTPANTITSQTPGRVNGNWGSSLPCATTCRHSQATGHQGSTSGL